MTDKPAREWVEWRLWNIVDDSLFPTIYLDENAASLERLALKLWDYWPVSTTVSLGSSPIIKTRVQVIE